MKMELQERKDPETEESNPNSKRDVVQSIIGVFGLYQLFVCAQVFLTKPPVAFHQMAILFLAPKIQYTCPDTNEETCPCSNPVYNRTVFENTMNMEYDLICGRLWMVGFNQTCFQLGTLVGSLLFGVASDKYGRRMPMLVAVTVQIVSGVASVFMPGYVTFTIMRFILGLTVGGTMVCGFVLMMEYIGTQYRDVISALYQVPFNIGHMLIPVYAYFFRDYLKFQLYMSLTTCVMVIYFVLLPESPRWLLAVKRTDEAVKLITKVAKVNKRPTEAVEADLKAYQASVAENSQKKGNIVDLFRTPNLRKHTLAMAWNWLACSYCFYGVSQYVGQLSGNPFVNVASSAGVTVLGSFASIPLMRIFGRRQILIVGNLLCGFCLILLGFFRGDTASLVLATIGVVASFIVFVVVYLYTGELFPTVVRNAAIGFCSMCARVGSMIAPFVIDLQALGLWVPPLFFAILPLIAGGVSFLLPETKGSQLMTTIEEGENFGKKTKVET